MTMPDFHLDDEQISAFRDDELGANAAAAVTTHLAECERCRNRLDSFTRVAALVAAPPAPLDHQALDQLIAAAVGEPVAPIVPLQRRRWLPVGAALAAAAVIVAILAVPAILDRGPGDGATMVAKGAADDDAEALSAGGAAGRATADAATTAEASAPSIASEAQTAGGTAVAREGETWLGPYIEETELVRRLVAELSTQAPSPIAPACEAVARDVAGTRVSSLAYAGRIAWRGTDAEVLVFALTEPVDGARRQAYVMATPDCAVLAEPRF